MPRAMLPLAAIALLIYLLPGCGGGASGPTAPIPPEQTLMAGPLEIGLASTAGFKQLPIPTPITSPVAFTAFFGSKITRLAQMGPGLIAFHGSSGTANEEIYTIMPDGTSRKLLAPHTARDLTPAWSPTGGQIAFTSTRGGTYNIHLMNPNGGAVTALTDTANWALHPAWSPDGQKIAYSSITATGTDIYAIGVNGGAAVNLTNVAGYDNDPAWSPDGRLIAFHSDRTGGTEQVMVMNADGQDVRALTTLNGQEPAWSPDGQKIAFVSWRTGTMQIWTMNPDGSGQLNTNVNGLCPSYTCDGREIVFERDNDIYIMRANGTRVRRIAKAGEPGDIVSVDCSPTPALARMLVGPTASDGGSNPPFGGACHLAVVGMTDADGVVESASLQVPNWDPLKVTTPDYGGNSLAVLAITGNNLQAMVEDRGRGLPVRRWAFPTNPETGSATIFFSASTGQIRSILTSTDVVPTAVPAKASAPGRIVLQGSFTSVMDARNPGISLSKGLRTRVVIDGNTGQILESL